MNSLNIAALSCVDIQKMNKGELTDISSMKLDPSVPQELLDNAPPLQDALSDFFQRKKSGL